MSKQEPPSHPDFPIPKTSSVVPHEGSATGSGSQQPQRVNPEVHDRFDGFMKGELKEGKVDHEEEVIEIAIPEEEVPFDGDLIYGDLVDEDGLPFYDEHTRRWINFPGHNNKITIPSYIERLARAVHEVVTKRE